MAKAGLTISKARGYSSILVRFMYRPENNYVVSHLFNNKNCGQILDFQQLLGLLNGANIMIVEVIKEMEEDTNLSLPVSGKKYRKRNQNFILVIASRKVYQF